MTTCNMANYNNFQPKKGWRKYEIREFKCTSSNLPNLMFHVWVELWTTRWRQCLISVRQKRLWFIFQIICRETDQHMDSKHLINTMLFLIFQVYKLCTDTFETYDQHYGRRLVKDTIKDGMCVCVCVCIKQEVTWG